MILRGPATRRLKKKEVPVRVNVLRDLREKYYQVDDAYLNGHARKCGIAATGVYNVLCRHINQQQRCFPSFRLIADRLGIAQKTVKRALDMLEYYNIIQITRTVGEHNFYDLLDKKCWRPVDDHRISQKMAKGRERHVKTETGDTLQ